MSEIFSAEWMESLKNAWNADPDIPTALAEIGFNSSIGYGFIDNETASGILMIENGTVISAGIYKGEALSWDFRAKQSQWKKWLIKPPGMSALSLAFTSGKLKIKAGDYGAMMKDHRMASPFIKSFSLMSQL